MRGCQIIDGRRIRFPDHEWVGGPWGEGGDELGTHMFDEHGGIYTSELSEHDRAHEGYEVDRLIVHARSREEVANYLGFGAEIINSNPLPENLRHGRVIVEVVVDCPVAHTQWLTERLASGLLFATKQEVVA